MRGYSVLLLFVGLTAVHARAEAPAALRSGFEESDAAAVWSLSTNGIASVSAEAARTGERSLKIVDGSDADGSSVFSHAVRVVPDRNCFAMAWAKCAEGSGLGFYVRFYAADGKTIEVDEAVYHKQVAFSGNEWTPVFLVVPAVAGAATCKVWLHSYNASTVTCFVDDVLLCWSASRDLLQASKWSGGYPDGKTTKDSQCALRWEHRLSGRLARQFARPADWSAHGALQFWLHNETPVDTTFVLTVTSENADTEGGDYYSLKIPIDWTGWRQFVVPFERFTTARSPLGWHHVEGMAFNAGGWGQTPDPDAVLVLDGVKLLPKQERE